MVSYFLVTKDRLIDSKKSLWWLISIWATSSRRTSKVEDGKSNGRTFLNLPECIQN